MVKIRYCFCSVAGVPFGTFMRDALSPSYRISIQRRDRSVPHLERKFYHCVMGLLCFSLYAFVLSWEEALILLAFIGGAMVAIDYVRLRNPFMNNLALRMFGRVMRREELESFSGNSFFVLGLLVVAVFFSKPIALLGVLCLAIGDPAAATVGSLYGKHRIVGKKSLEGALANWFGVALASFIFGMTYLSLNLSGSLRLSLVAGTVSMIVELLPFPLDDNFTIPVCSAVFFTLIQSFVPLF
jgi:diacylglycerol kinase (CTP)